MKRLSALILVLLADYAVAEPARAVHTVRAGETLSCLAGEYLANPRRWPELLTLNPQIKSPESLKIGDRLRLPQGSEVALGADPFVCQPQWMPQGWRTPPTAKPVRLAGHDRGDRHLTLLFDQHLHAKPGLPKPSNPLPAPSALAAPALLAGLPLRTPHSPRTRIYSGADGAFYIVAGGNAHGKPNADPGEPVALGRNIVIDRALLNPGQD